MILPQTLTLVNPRKFELWNEKKQLNAKISEKMKLAGMNVRARRVEECAAQFNISLCPNCGHYEVSRAVLCHDRLCPVCCWRLSLKRFATMMQLIGKLLKAYPNSRWSFMTLTVKNCVPERLNATLRKMSEAYNRMRQRKAFKRSLDGWARTVEVTYNAKTNELHPHFHVLVMWAAGADPIVDGARLLNNWVSSCRDDLIASYKAQDIEVIEDGNREVTHEQLLRQPSPDDIARSERLARSVLEAFKYTQKSSDLLEMPIEVFKAYADNMQGVRAVSFGGVLKEYAKALGIPEEERAAAEEGFTICPNCGSSAIAEAVYKWSFAQHSYLKVPEQPGVEKPVEAVEKRRTRRKPKVRL